MKKAVLPFAVLLFAAAGFAQHDHAAAPPAPPTEGQKSFEVMKTLAGSWEGPLTTQPAMKETAGVRMKVMLRVTSRGNAILHEMTMSNRPDDPITMMYVDGDHLALTHFCDAGNRPHMTGTVSEDGKSVAFKLVDVSGSLQRGNMADAVFTIVDANHHLEDWTYNYPGTIVHAHFDLQRTKDASGAFGQ